MVMILVTVPAIFLLHIAMMVYVDLAWGGMAVVCVWGGMGMVMVMVVDHTKLYIGKLKVNSNGGLLLLFSFVQLTCEVSIIRNITPTNEKGN